MPRQVDHEARRIEVADAVLRVLTDAGIDGLSLRRIAEETEASTGLLTHYFANREELVFFALDHAYARAELRMRDVAQVTPARSALRAVLIEALPLDRERREEWHAWLALWLLAVSSDALRAEHVRRYGIWRGAVRRLVAAAVADGSVPSTVRVRDAAEALVAAVDGLGLQALHEPDRLSRRQLRARIDSLLQLLFDSQL